MADQRLQYTEEMVGAGHPTKSDTLNRLMLIDHNTDGTHKKPCFSAHKNGVNQTGVMNTWTKVTFGTEEFDTNANYDVATSRFTPTVARKYLLTGVVELNPSTTNAGYSVGIYKNGALWKEGASTNANSTTEQGLPFSIIVDANGTTDYFEVYVITTSASSQTIDGGIAATYFQGCGIG